MTTGRMPNVQMKTTIILLFLCMIMLVQSTPAPKHVNGEKWIWEPPKNFVHDYDDDDTDEYGYSNYFTQDDVTGLRSDDLLQQTHQEWLEECASQDYL